MPRLLDVIKRHRVTHIVHAAAFVGAVSAANPALSVQVNVMGMVNVLEAARAFDVARVVYTSAKGIYGPVLGEYGAPTYKPVPEDLPKNPKRIYDSAKLMAEQAALYYQANMGLDAVVLRFATTYGPGKTARHGKMGVTSAIVENPASGLPFRLAQGGDEKDDFIYNKDSAYGIYLACTAENPKSRVYNIGTGVGITLNDVARVIRKHLPHAEIEIGPGLNFLGMPYPASNVYDISRARAELGYAPQVDLREGERRRGRKLLCRAVVATTTDCCRHHPTDQHERNRGRQSGRPRPAAQRRPGCRPGGGKGWLIRVVVRDGLERHGAP